MDSYRPSFYIRWKIAEQRQSLPNYIVVACFQKRRTQNLPGMQARYTKIQQAMLCIRHSLSFVESKSIFMWIPYYLMKFHIYLLISLRLAISKPRTYWEDIVYADEKNVLRILMIIIRAMSCIVYIENEKK